MKKQGELHLVTADPRDVELFRNYFLNETAMVDAPKCPFSDGYRFIVTKINDDGTFEGRLIAIWPCV